MGIFEPARQSYQRLHGNFQKMSSPNTPMIETLLGYYKGANNTLAAHSPLLIEQQSRFQLYKDLSHHHDLLQRGTRADGHRTETGGIVSSASAPQLGSQIPP